jgi:hypothetical protein
MPTLLYSMDRESRCWPVLSARRIVAPDVRPRVRTSERFMFLQMLKLVGDGRNALILWQLNSGMVSTHMLCR